MFHLVFRLALDQPHAGQIQVPVDSAEACLSFWITFSVEEVLYYRRAVSLVNTSKFPATDGMSELVVESNDNLAFYGHRITNFCCY